TLARAVHYAHQRGLAHGNLKPSNVLLTPPPSPARQLLTRGGSPTAPKEAGWGVPPDSRAAPLGTPKITDFGLTRPTDDTPGQPPARRPPAPARRPPGPAARSRHRRPRLPAPGAGPG